MMGTVTVMLVAASWLASSVVPVVGQEPSVLPPPWFDGQQVEVSQEEAGLEPSYPPLGEAMVLESVEPHVVRVLDDGAGHDLTDLDMFEDSKPASLLSVGEGGSVWLTSSGGFIEIGTPGEVPDPLDTYLAQMEIGPDGTLWIADSHHGASIGRLDSGSWTIHELSSTAWLVGLDATPEGGLDFAWRDGSTLMFGEWSEGDSEPTIAASPPPLELGSPDGHIAVAHTPDGRMWVAEGLWWQEEQRREPGRLWQFDGVSWNQAEPLGTDSRTRPNEMVVDGAGRLWITWREVVPGTADFGPSSYLTRRDDERSWTVFSDPDKGAAGGWLLPDEDGVWLAPEGWCSGYARFDGEHLTRYLDDLCMRRPGISPTGDIWLFGHRRDRKDAGVYVITPTPDPEVTQQRVEIPEVGVVASFPDDWTVTSISQDPDLGFLAITRGERFGPDVNMQPVLMAEPGDQEPGDMLDACTLALYRPIAVAPAEFMEELYGQAEGIAVESLGVQLSRVRLDPGVVLSERYNGQYAVAGEDAIAFLWCWAMERPDDYWLSIAESIEFVPVGE
jgi:hypothetical protein